MNLTNPSRLVISITVESEEKKITTESWNEEILEKPVFSEIVNCSLDRSQMQYVYLTIKWCIIIIFGYDFFHSMYAFFLSFLSQEFITKREVKLISCFFLREKKKKKVSIR